MGCHILIRCPNTGMKVQHWLAETPAEPNGSYLHVACPACARLHFVNSKTGKLLGDK
jgi:hypothetical protein